MSKKTVYLLGILFTIIIGSFLYYYFCSNSCQNTTNNKQSTISNTSNGSKSLNPFSIAGADLDIRANENFNFNYSGHTILMPIPELLKDSVEKLKTYMALNPSKILKVIGLFKEEESNTSTFKNLGLARADAVKTQLSSWGISADKIITSEKISDSLHQDINGVLHGPFVLLIDENLSEQSLLKKELLKSPTLMTFDFGKHKTSNVAFKKEFIEALVNYLNSDEENSCTIVGHCDSDGSDQFNLKLGQRRADFTKSQLLKLNISSSKIKTISKGEFAPIATNNTAAGKAKNRRTQVIIN